LNCSSGLWANQREQSQKGFHQKYEVASELRFFPRQIEWRHWETESPQTKEER
jgi:hypothetical protein